MNHPFTKARWIWSADDAVPRVSIRRFRSGFSTSTPRVVTINVSADCRYELYLDGNPIGRGPAKSDLRNYIFDTYEVSLAAGRHTIAALVIAYDKDTGPVSEMHDRGAFILEAQTENGESLIHTDSDGTWRLERDTAYEPLLGPDGREGGYFAVGATERVDGARIPRGWTELDFDDTGWEVPVAFRSAFLRGTPSEPSVERWRLTPRDIPAMRSETRDFANTAESLPLTVPAGETRELILDAGAYAIGYPEIAIEGGRGGEVELRYAEALRQDGKKTRRDFYEGGEVLGPYDIYRPDGGGEAYRPLHWRAFRFVKIAMRAGSEPLTVRSAGYEATGYPWTRRAEFDVAGSSSEVVKSIQEVDFRTLQSCTWETFMDCPYYEQLQYVGDTRLQALVSYVTTGDTCLGRRAVRQFDSSRIPDGLTQSRYPSNVEQIIPPFSLLWILMVEDLWRYSPADTDTVAQCLSGCRGILEWFGRRLTTDGVIDGRLPYWNFVDWTWKGGVPPPLGDGQPSATINLMYLAALQSYIRMHEGLGDARESEFWQAEADMLADAITLTFWDSENGLLREGPTSQWGFTQHAQAWGILTDIIPANACSRVVEALHSDDRLAKTTYYHTFYVVEALAKVNRLERLWSHWLAPWRHALDLGHTTWPEEPEPSRSDCHAWSSWPTYAFLTHVLGVRPADSDEGETRIEPRRVDGWDRVWGKAALPSGDVEVSVDWSGGRPKIESRLGDD